MKSDTPLDYAVFQLSPKCSRCELFVSGDGNTEKLASGLLKPFVTHLKVVEEQVAQVVQSIKLEVDKHKNSGTWFTKGTLERFVRFVSTPEVLELVNTFDAEVSQLEAAQRIYSQGAGDRLSCALSGDETGAAAAADVTKKELLRAIDVRLVAVTQDLTMACARASAAGFTPDTVSELLLFAEQFGTHRLNEACNKYISLSHRRPGLINTWKGGGIDRSLRSSSGSDMSIDDPTKENIPIGPNGPHQSQHQHQQQNQQETSKEPDTTQQHLEQSKPSACDQFKSSIFQIRRSFRESSSERDKDRENGAVENEKEESVTESSQTSQPSRRLSVQDRINLFENKQKEQSGSGGKVVVGKSAELRKLPSVVSSAPQVVEKAVLRRWSGASDMSIELSMETESSSCTSCSSSNSQTLSKDKDLRGLKGTATSSNAEFRGLLGTVENSGLKDRSVSQTWVGGFSGGEEDVGSKDQTDSKTQLRVLSGRLEVVGLRDQSVSRPQLTPFSERADNVGRKDQMPSEAQLRSFLDRAEDVVLKNRAASQTPFRSFPGEAEQVGLIDQAASQTLFRTSSNGAEHAVVKDQVASQVPNRGLLGQVEVVGLTDRAVPRNHSGASSSRADDVGSEDEPSHVPPREFLNSMENVRLRDQLANELWFRASSSTAVKIALNSKDPLASQIQSKAVSGKLEGSIGVKDCRASQAQYKGFEAPKLDPRSQWRSFPGEVKSVRKKAGVLLETHSESFPTKVEDSGLLGMKLQRQISAPQQSRKVQKRRGKSDPVYGSGGPVFFGRKVTESQETFGSVVTAPVEQVEKVKESKGNQELNDELQMKANELEKLFAAHKLQVPGDQSSSARRNKPTNIQEQLACFLHRKPAEVAPIQLPNKNSVGGIYRSSSTVAEFDVNSLIKMVDNQDHGNFLKQNISELGCPEDSRGKFYDRYMKKREAKLREEWGSKSAQKEAKMKAMHDSLERSKAELMAKFAGSADRHNSALQARRRAQKLRSFSVHSAMKNREQSLFRLLSEEDEDLSEFVEQTLFEPQKPILVANVSHFQSRKDMTKGFKRLLKLRRKSHGRESLVDWISATTSEGDDDTEDGRDLANWSVEDPRKSKIGFSLGHPSYDGLNQGELFNEHVQAFQSSIPEPPANFKLMDDHLSENSLKAPQSFFSLATFRSKGSESKPR